MLRNRDYGSENTFMLETIISRSLDLYLETSEAVQLEFYTQAYVCLTAIWLLGCML